jgi:hypothetical protein
MVKRWLMAVPYVVRQGALQPVMTDAKQEMCRSGATVGISNTPEHRCRCQIRRAMNVLRCHAGGTRIFFISGTNYMALYRGTCRSRGRRSGRCLSSIAPRRAARQQRIENNCKFS